MIELTGSQAQIIKNALAMNYPKRRWGFRNSYNTGAEGANKTVNYLVELGLMRHVAGDCYEATRQGGKAVYLSEYMLDKIFGKESQT